MKTIRLLLMRWKLARSQKIAAEIARSIELYRAALDSELRYQRGLEVDLIIEQRVVA